MQKIYAAFNAWMEKYKTHLTELGGRLESTGRAVTPTGVTDGPFPESKGVIGGFMILTADSYETAVQIAQEFPAALCPGSSIESAKSPPDFSLPISSNLG
jgi:hypothetical protein